MSDYATIAELKERLTGFYDEFYKDPVSGLVDDAKAQKHLNAAEAEVNASVAVRYNVPVVASQPLELLKNWTLTLAEELAHGRDGSDELPEKLKDRVTNVRKLLQRLADGSVAFMGAAEKSSSAGGDSDFISSRPLCRREQMGGW